MFVQSGVNEIGQHVGIAIRIRALLGHVRLARDVDHTEV